MTTKMEIIEEWHHFCTCVNFGESALDARAIRFMNTFPTMLKEVIE